MKPETCSPQQLVDHRGAMAFIDELLAIDEDGACCSAAIRADNPFLVNNRLPAWVLVEYMAQAVAVFSAYTGAVKGSNRRHGLLLGCRDIRLTVEALAVGARLEIEILEIASFGELTSFKGKVTCNGGQAASGTLSVWEAAEWPTGNAMPRRNPTF